MLHGRGIELLSPNCVDINEKFLNICDNEFNSLESLHFLSKVEEIIADNNKINDIKLPKLLNLVTLSLNKNKIDDLEVLLESLSINAPKLKLLSLLGNPVCPDSIYSHINKLKRDNINKNITDTDERFETIKIDKTIVYETIYFDNDDDYTRYRLRVIYRIPHLKFLDSTPVTAEERMEANRRGQFLETRKSSQSNLQPTKQRKSLVSIAPGMSDWLSAFNPLRYDDEFKESNQTLSPLPEDSNTTGNKTNKRICYGKNQYEYKGRYSEGNRFIQNFDL